ncbi:MAG TPA: 23S rRNA (uracil(747)-C(5))-methyltransferase RlmC [Xanthomonadales bacterium]|nr:23S rRNA (uracil(747)-C(5))-methyltransferase RlmC [Xanthomonadales bacterium]
MHCPHFEASRCRSCSLLATPYDAQLAAKEAQLRALLPQAGVAWTATVRSAEAGFRNKAKMAVAGSVDAPVLGILDAGGQGVALGDCALYPPAMQALFPVLARFITSAKLEPYSLATRRGELKYLLLTQAPDTGDAMLRFVVRSQEPIARIRKHLPALLAETPALRVVSANLQPEHKAVLEGEREIVLTDEDTLTMRVNGLPLHLGPQSFFQTNSAVAAELYGTARDWTRELAPGSAWDLYCGVGGFALHLADAARSVLGVESSALAVASARRSAAELGLGHVRFEAGDAGAFARAQSRWPELVVVNPPRRGIGADLARAIEASTTRHVVYSSCNAESLARDLAQMPSLHPRRARLLDMFPHTAHYEAIVLLERA